MKKKQYDDDDGRVIADMNVEGMPWHTGIPRREKKRGPEEKEAERPELTGKEKRALIRGVLLASMSVAAIFAVVLTCFILFCVFVWLK